ncbi:MAG: recombinase family protein [Planctomycetes bacterium]|nr:recombinase family protein [Planctomycetota bacterium]
MKGQNEKVLQGWLPCGVPFGYTNVENRDEPILPHPEESQTVIRMFDLYSTGNMTFEMLTEQLWREGHIYRPSQPKFSRTGLSYMLNNRFYIGEINYRGQTHPGRHKPLVSRQMFQACQEVLNGRTRSTNNRNHPLTGGVFTCAYCGSMITGELIRRSLRNGEVREHLYYRCANNHPNHPTVRWKAEDLEQAIHEDLASMKLDAELADWFRRSLTAAFADTDAQQQRQRQMLLKRRTELTNMQDRLLSAYLSSNIDEVAFQNKSVDLKAQLGETEAALQSCGDMDSSRGDAALALFNWSQQAADVWFGSKMDVKREILGEIALNRTLSDVTLCLEKRKPFDILVKRPSFQSSRGGGI